MLYMKKNNKMLPLTGSTLYADTPVGTIIPYTGDVAPKGYLMCYGQEVAIADYPELYDVIGDKFANGQTPTTGNFFLPDGREATFKGAGLNGQLTDSHVSANGLSVGDYLDDRIKLHKHTVMYGNSYANLPIRNVYTSSGASGLRIELDSTSSNAMTVSNTGYATNEVKAFGVNYIIKAKFVALPIDIMDAVSEEYATKEELQYHLLWENPNPTANFVAQTITAQDLGVDLSIYKSIKVYVRNTGTGSHYSLTEVIKDLPASAMVFAGQIYGRSISFEDSGITFGDGLAVTTYGTPSVQTGVVLPQKIFGIM